MRADAIRPKSHALLQRKKVSPLRRLQRRRPFTASSLVCICKHVPDHFYWSAVCTGVKRNANFAKLQAGYLFPEVSPQKALDHCHDTHAFCELYVPIHLLQIAKRRREHQEANPDAKIISLGIGDTTEPIPQVIADAMAAAAAGMATREGYSGYDIFSAFTVLSWHMFPEYA